MMIEHVKDTIKDVVTTKFLEPLIKEIIEEHLEVEFEISTEYGGGSVASVEVFWNGRDQYDRKSFYTSTCSIPEPRRHTDY